jgi:Ca-activated chloride channel family protein
MQFATSVTAFGLLMKESEYKGSANKQMVKDLGESAISFDPHAYRAEFLQLVDNWN